MEALLANRTNYQVTDLIASHAFVRRLIVQLTLQTLLDFPLEYSIVTRLLKAPVVVVLAIAFGLTGMFRYKCKVFRGL